VIFINSHLILLKEKYENKLYANKKTPIEVLEYINKKFNLEEIEENSIKYLRELEFIKINCLNAESNKNKIKYDDLDIRTYEIKQDDLSFKYYQKYNQNKTVIRPIYIMIETNTAYLNCNDDTLYKQLIVYQGVSQYEIDNNAGDLYLYLRLIDELECENNL